MNPKIIFLISFLIITKVSFSQNRDSTHLSNLQLFTGNIQEKEIIKIGEIPIGLKFSKYALVVSTVNITDILNGEVTSAIKFEYVYPGSSEIPVGIVDYDEVSDLLIFLNLLSKNYLNTTKENYLEVNYFARSGFQAGCYFSIEKQEWKLFFKLDLGYKDINVFLDANDISPLYGKIQLASTQMKKKE